MEAHHTLVTAQVLHKLSFISSSITRGKRLNMMFLINITPVRLADMQHRRAQHFAPQHNVVFVHLTVFWNLLFQEVKLVLRGVPKSPWCMPACSLIDLVLIICYAPRSMNIFVPCYIYAQCLAMYAMFGGLQYMPMSLSNIPAVQFTQTQASFYFISVI